MLYIYTVMKYAELCSLSHYSFLSSASSPAQLVERAAELDYQALAITDQCSLAGVVKAYAQASRQDQALQLIIGSSFILSDGCELVVLCPDRAAYAELSGLITLARRRSPKGAYELHMEDLRFRLKHCLIIWLIDCDQKQTQQWAHTLKSAFPQRLWLGVHHSHQSGEQLHFQKLVKLSQRLELPMVACGRVQMHGLDKKPLLDVVTAIRLNTSIQQLGEVRQQNAERYLKPLPLLQQMYPEELLHETLKIAERCTFSLDELKYQYPRELVPDGISPSRHLQQLVSAGAHQRWPNGVPDRIQQTIDKELTLIKELHYEYYFLTVEDIVRFARSRDILCQGRGSSANSVVCYCLGITEISPELINVLLERFISKERNEPPDIDVDFEHQRREEVIQYIYQKYGRERAALAATVITYRARSAIRDVGKALGLDAQLIDVLAKSLAWWDRTGDLQKRVAEAGMRMEQKTMQLFYDLVQQILGFPRHLSQHVGGFLITQGQVSELVPIENASMPDRTVVQWDKEDIEALGLLKVDVLGLGMLSALKRMLNSVSRYCPEIQSLADIPKEDPHTYEMLCQGDSVGVFQVESRAQMSMLPRLKPRKFYDLVIEIAIVRPGPIQGDMVHPYLLRRDGIEQPLYPSDEIREVLEPTLGVPIFQEQAIKLTMVAAGFTGGEADQLRRAMATWGKNGNLMQFKDKLISGMLDRGYPEDFAERLFEQIKGFGGYGFPESHSASFALLCYASSWFKCHHPAAFYCALLNSQPMGFYSPSQLMQDARRHQVKVLPVDIQKSQWDNRLELAPRNPAQPEEPSLRLGFSRIRGFRQDSALLIEQKRPTKGFDSLTELSRTTGLERAQLEKLAAADALKSISGNRYQSHWQASAIEPSRPLLNARPGHKRPSDSSQAMAAQNPYPMPEVKLPTPCIQENVRIDYQTTGLSLRAHPMAILRSNPPFDRCKRSLDLADIGHSRFVRVAGLVTGRQRPGTAKGTLFLTLEDETGNTNVIIWKRTQDMFRAPLLNAKLLLIKGTLETNGPVIHLIAGHLTDLSHLLGDLSLKSRDFH